MPLQTAYPFSCSSYFTLNTHPHIMSTFTWFLKYQIDAEFEVIVFPMFA